MNTKKETSPTAYSKWIEDYLEKSGISSYKLDALSGVSQVTIDRIRSGQSKSPSRATIRKLEQVIKTPSPDTNRHYLEEEGSEYNVIDIIPFTIDASAMTQTLDQLDKEFPDWRRKANDIQAMLIKPFYEEVVNAQKGENNKRGPTRSS